MKQSKWAEQKLAVVEAEPKNWKLDWLRSKVGTVIISGRALAVVTMEEMNVAMNRHLITNWRTLEARFQGRTTAAIRKRDALVTIHESGDGTEFWVITDLHLRTRLMLANEL